MESFEELIRSARVAGQKGAWDEALAGYERAFACARAGSDPAPVADVLRWIGTVHRERGDVDLAVEAYDASLAIAECCALHAHEAAALNCKGIVEQYRGRPDKALECYTRARELARRVGDRRLAAMIAQNMGALANIRGRLDEALAHFTSALKQVRELDDRWTLAHTLNNVGMMHVDLDQLDEAARHFDEAAALAAEVDDLQLAGTVELNRAELELKRARLEDARVACERALAVFTRLRSKSGLGEAYKLFGSLFREAGEAARAEAHFAIALGLAESTESLLLQAETRVEWARLHFEEGRPKQGITYLNHGFRLFGQLQAELEIADLRRRIARLEDFYLEAVRGWGEILSGDTGWATIGHTERVAAYSCALAAAAGLDGWEITVVRIGALIHDIGSAAVRRGLSGPAIPRPQHLRRLHVIAGDALAREMAFPPEVRAIVRGHHERWDGTGYPDRLAGENIPLEARIVAIANAFDNLIDRDGLPAAEALRRMNTEASRAFDPALIAHLNEMPLQRGSSAPPWDAAA